MRLGVISDTHGNTKSTQEAIRLLDSFDVAAVLHCGDIGTVDVVELLAATGWPTHFVIGNTDYRPSQLADAIQRGGMNYHHLFGDLQFGECRVALLHSHDAQQFASAKAGGDYDLVCYGHTHVKKVERIGETVVLNPGALHRANPHSIAIVDLPALETEIVDL